MRYGMPYMGSKNKLAERIVALLPKAEHLYDVFCGGCALAHCAALSGKYEHIHINDISDMPRLFVDAVSGKYHDERRWISREDFFALKDGDPYVRACWSFGNNGRDYLYSRETEPYKRAVHKMLTADSVRERRVAYKEVVRLLVPLIGSKTAKSLGNMQRLQSLESLERLNLDYRDVPIEDGGVVYCDPPYRGVSGYVTGAFDHDAFYDWVRNAEFPVYVSEYSMPEDFIPVWEKPVAVLANQKGTDGKVTERLYLHEKWAHEVWKPTLF